MQSYEVLSGGAFAPAAGSGTGAAAQITATLAAIAGKTAFLTGFDITGGGATAASVINATITGLAAQSGTTLNYGLAIVAGATLAGITGGGLAVKFDKPLTASAPNVAIVLTVPSFGAGNTLASCNIYGYYL